MASKKIARSTNSLDVASRSYEHRLILRDLQPLFIALRHYRIKLRMPAVVQTFFSTAHEQAVVRRQCNGL